MFLTLIWIFFSIIKFNLEGYDAVFPISASHLLVLIGLDILIYRTRKLKKITNSDTLQSKLKEETKQKVVK